VIDKRIVPLPATALVLLGRRPALRRAVRSVAGRWRTFLRAVRTDDAARPGLSGWWFNRALFPLYAGQGISEIYDRWFGKVGRPGPLLAAMYYLNTFSE